jgi:hypothetical protein
MRTQTVSVGPLVTPAPNNIATSQTPPGTGSATATFTATSASISATNSFVAGQPVTFNSLGTGLLPTNIANGVMYYVISTGLSGSAFQVAATVGGTAIVAASSSTGTCKVYFGNALVLNGTLAANGVATLDTARRVLITTADTTHSFTVNGANAAGAPLTEVVGPISTSGYTAQDFATVTSITINGAATAAVTVGTNGIASTQWAHFDSYANSQVAIEVDVTGTVNYTIQQTLDDPNSINHPTSVSSLTWINTSDSAGVGATGSIQSNYAYAPVYARVLLNSGTGSLTAKFTQFGAVPF